MNLNAAPLICKLNQRESLEAVLDMDKIILIFINWIHQLTAKNKIVINKLLKIAKILNILIKKIYIIIFAFSKKSKSTF